MGARAGVGRGQWPARSGRLEFEISGETCVGWGEDTKLEAGEVWARVSGPRERRTREPRAAGLWLRSVSCGDPRRMLARGGAEAGKGFLEPWGTSGPRRAIVRREDGSKQNELCVARGKSDSEGVRRLNGDQLHPPLPRLRSDWERPGRGMAAPSPFSSGSYSALHPQSRFGRGDPRSWGEPRDTGPGGAGAGAGLAKGGCSDVSGGVCVCAREGGWAVSLFL